MAKRVGWLSCVAAMLLAVGCATTEEPTAMAIAGDSDNREAEAVGEPAHAGQLDQPFKGKTLQQLVDEGMVVVLRDQDFTTDSGELRLDALRWRDVTLKPDELVGEREPLGDPIVMRTESHRTVHKITVHKIRFERSISVDWADVWELFLNRLRRERDMQEAGEPVSEDATRRY